MLLRSVRNQKTSRPGIAAMEMAILAPFLVFIFLVVWDFSRIFEYAIIVENCARNGARWAADPTYFLVNFGDPYTTVSAAALADSQSITPTPTVSAVYVNDANGDPCVQVTVTYQFSTVATYSIPGLFNIPTSVNLTRTVQMQMVPAAPG